MKTLKVAVVGVGSISSFHIKSYLQNPEVEVYAFCDINEDRLRIMGEKYGVTRLYTDEAEMLRALPEIDLVSVCTWNSAHAPCSIMALDAGKHVLCEKPMARTVEEARAMQEAAERNGKLLMIGFVRRFGKDCALAESLIAEGKLGEIYYAKAQYLRRNGHPGGWFGKKEFSGGGPLIDLGVHSIDLVRYLMGKPKAVSVYGATFMKLGDRPSIKGKKEYIASSRGLGECDCEDLAAATIRFDNGAVLTAEMSFSLNMEKDRNSVELFGTGAGLVIDKAVRMFGEEDGALKDFDFEGETGLNVKEAFYEEINHFVRAAKGEIPCKNTAEDGVALMEILTAIYRSAESGHEVLL